VRRHDLAHGALSVSGAVLHGVLQQIAADDGVKVGVHAVSRGRFCHAPPTLAWLKRDAGRALSLRAAPSSPRSALSLRRSAASSPRSAAPSLRR
jgi:hypothetical protein